MKLMVVEVIPGTEIPPKKKRYSSSWKYRRLQPIGKNASKLVVEITKQEEALQKYLSSL